MSTLIHSTAMNQTPLTGMTSRNGPLLEISLQGSVSSKKASNDESSVVQERSNTQYLPQANLDAEVDVYQDPRVDAREKQLAAQEKKQQQAIDREVSALAARDREVRAHEQAHMAAGGQYAGAARYEFQRGPNGVSYAVGGEVPISTSPASTPEETIKKAQVIRSAALAPAEPSSQDRKVAAMASQMEASARAEIVQAKKEEAAVQKAANLEKVETEKLDDDNEAMGKAEESQEKPSSTIDNRLTSRISNIYLEGRSPGVLLSEHA